MASIMDLTAEQLYRAYGERRDPVAAIAAVLIGEAGGGWFHEDLVDTQAYIEAEAVWEQVLERVEAL